MHARNYVVELIKLVAALDVKEIEVILAFSPIVNLVLRAAVAYPSGKTK